VAFGPLLDYLKFGGYTKGWVLYFSPRGFPFKEGVLPLGILRILSGWGGIPFKSAFLALGDLGSLGSNL